MSIIDKKSVVRLSWQDLIDYSMERDPQNGLSPDPLNRFFTLDQDNLVSGRFEGYRLGLGLGISIFDLHPHRDIEILKQVIEPEVGIGIILQGSCEMSYTDEMGRIHQYPAGSRGSMARSSDDSHTWHLKLRGGQTHTMIRLNLPKEHMPELIEGCEAELPPSLRQIFLAGTSSSRHAARGTISPSLEFLVRQTLQCPYRGGMRQLFMEGKALEIFACELDEFSECATKEPTSKDIREVERLHHARRILEEEFAEPPSLLELAHRIGTNDFKLKRGFRDVFGITVFEYVRKLRMEKARSLLEAGELSVAEIALAAGYSHFGYFSSVFKKSFGVLPSHYRRSCGAKPPVRNADPHDATNKN